MKKIILSSFIFLFLVTSVGAVVLNNPEKLNSEMSIDQDGKVSLKNAKVTQLIGNTIFVRLLWGESFVRMTVKTDNKTSIAKKYGEVSSISEIKVGDRLNIDGGLEPALDSLTLKATSVKNVSDEREQNNFSGVILGTKGNGRYDFRLTDGRNIILEINNSTNLVKGTRKITFYEIRNGDTIEGAEGVFDHSSQILKANKARVYVDMSIFQPKNFQGKLKSISGISLPTNLTVEIGGINYTIKMPADCWIWNTKREFTQLSRFVVGDTIRIWGSIPEDDLTLINAEIVRNISL